MLLIGGGSGSSFVSHPRLEKPQPRQGDHHLRRCQSPRGPQQRLHVPHAVYLAEDEEDNLATAAEGEVLGTTKALQPAADSAMQAINPSFMTFARGLIAMCLRPRIEEHSGTRIAIIPSNIRP